MTIQKKESKNPSRLRIGQRLPGPTRKGAVVHLSMGNDSVGIWAHRVGAWVKGPGWDFVFPTEGLSGITAFIERKELQGRVREIGIVAHGDDGGIVQLSPILTTSSLDSPELASQLEKIREYLVPDGMLTFYSCIAGVGSKGSDFLVALSKRLEGRTVVAFTLWGLIGAENTLNQAGMMTAISAPEPRWAMKPENQHGHLTPWCPFAKKAKNGQIVYLPHTERYDRAQRTGGPPGGFCANPQCRGHAKLEDRCPGW